MVRKFADLGIKGTGNIDTTTYEGVVQQELTTALKDVRACKLKVFEILQEKLVPHPPTPAKSSAIRIDNSSDVTMEGNVIQGFETAIDVNRSSGIQAKGNIIQPGEATHFPPPDGKFRQLTNAEIRSRLNELTRAMRAFEIDYRKQIDAVYDSTSRTFEERMRRSDELHASEKEQFVARFSGEAVSLASEILYRVGSVQSPRQPEKDISLGAIVVLHRTLAGPSPIAAAADFLDYMVQQLPP